MPLTPVFIRRVAVATASVGAAGAGLSATLPRRPAQQRPLATAAPPSPCDCDELWACMMAGDGRDCSAQQRSLDACMAAAAAADSRAQRR